MCPSAIKRRRRYAPRRQRKGTFHFARLNVFRTKVTTNSHDQRAHAIWTSTRTSAIHATVPKKRRNILQVHAARHGGLPAKINPQSASVEDLCEHLRQLSLRSLDAVPPSADVDVPFTALIDQLCELMSHLTLAEEPRDTYTLHRPTGSEIDEARPSPQDTSYPPSEHDKESDMFRTTTVE